MSSQVKRGSLAPWLEAPTELTITGLSSMACRAQSTATFRAGKDPENPTAAQSPGFAPARSSMATRTPAMFGLVDVRLAGR